ESEASLAAGVAGFGRAEPGVRFSTGPAAIAPPSATPGNSGEAAARSTDGSVRLFHADQLDIMMRRMHATAGPNRSSTGRFGISCGTQGWIGWVTGSGAVGRFTADPWGRMFSRPFTN